MNYISYPEIHAPKGQEHPPVSANSLESTDYIHSLETMNSSLQSKKTVQSTDSLKTTPTTNQTSSLNLGVPSVTVSDGGPQYTVPRLHKALANRTQTIIPKEPSV